jgi:hypothetical protein
VFDPMPSASTGHTFNAIDWRVTTAGLRRIRSSRIASSVAVTASARSSTNASRAAGSKLKSPQRNTGSFITAGLREQLREVEWLDEVVISAAIQAGDPIRGPIECSEHEHGDGDPPSPDRGKGVVATHPRHPPVEHDDLVLIGGQVGQRRLAIGNGVNDVPILGQPTNKHPAKRFIVLRKQHAHRSSSPAQPYERVTTCDHDCPDRRHPATLHDHPSSNRKARARSVVR